jgi:hypothetical protein
MQLLKLCHSNGGKMRMDSAGKCTRLRIKAGLGISRLQTSDASSSCAVPGRGRSGSRVALATAAAKQRHVTARFPSPVASPRRLKLESRYYILLQSTRQIRLSIFGRSSQLVLQTAFVFCRIPATLEKWKTAPQTLETHPAS